MQRVVFGLGVATMFGAIVGAMVWLQGGLAASEKKGQRPTHLHCPECGLEMTYKADLDGKSCPQCGSSGPKMIATVGPNKNRKAGDDVGALGKLLVAVLVAVVLEAGLLYAWILHRGSRQRAQEEAKNQLLVCNCPFCERRIGYPARKVGAGMLCPRCKTAFTLPNGVAVGET